MDHAIAPVKAEKLTATQADHVLSEAHSFGLSVQQALGPKTLDGRGLEGRVLVAFSLGSNGALTNARVAQSSGHHELDNEALKIVGRAAFPSPPVKLCVTHRTFVSAFTFT
jgi:TonB family protein